MLFEPDTFEEPNPIGDLDPDSPLFLEQVEVIASVLVPGEPMGRALITALIAFHIIEARRLGITPSLAEFQSSLRVGLNSLRDW